MEEPIACGIWTLIESSIHHYILEHGRKPFALVLHPAHVAEFCGGMNADHNLLDAMAIPENLDYAMSVLMNKHGDITDL